MASFNKHASLLSFECQKLHTIHNLVELHEKHGFPASLSNDITWDDLNTEQEKLKTDYMLNVNDNVRKSNTNLDEATTNANILEKEVGFVLIGYIVVFLRKEKVNESMNLCQNK